MLGNETLEKLPRHESMIESTATPAIDAYAAKVKATRANLREEYLQSHDKRFVVAKALEASKVKEEPFVAPTQEPQNASSS
jgi:hypothetical protein